MDREVVAAVAIGALCVLALGAPMGSLDAPDLPSDDLTYDILVPDVDVTADAGDQESTAPLEGASAGGLGALPMLVVLVLWAIGAFYVSSVREFVVASLVLGGLGLAAIERFDGASTATVGAVTIPGTGSQETLYAALVALVLLAAGLVVGQPWVRRFARRDHGLPVFRGRGDESPSDADRGPPSASSDVGRALHALRQEVGLDARTATPREIRARAIEHGHDPGAVEAITERFELAKYGGRSLSDDDVAAVRDARHRIESRDDE